MEHLQDSLEKMHLQVVYYYVVLGTPKSFKGIAHGCLLPTDKDSANSRLE